MGLQLYAVQPRVGAKKQSHAAGPMSKMSQSLLGQASADQEAWQSRSETKLGTLSALFAQVRRDTGEIRVPIR